jgi:hypothetical protein
MEQNDGEFKRSLSDDEWKELIKEVDSKTDSPLQRSNKILAIIRKSDPDISMYDLWCFAVHILQTLMSEFDAIRGPVKAVNNLIYQLHYRLHFYKQVDKL